MQLVSIIVPVYKVEKYLDRCVQSIRKQSYPALEIILVDDGSPDNCGSMCDNYAKEDERIKVIHKENGGLSDARNVGITKATGEYLLFVDSDDYIDSGLVEKTVMCAEKQNADMVVFDFMNVEEDTGLEEDWHMPLERNVVNSPEEEPELFLSSPSACNKLYTRRLWSDTHIQFPKGRNYEDLSTIPKLYLHAKRVVYLDSEPLYYYIQRTGSIMHSQNFKQSYENRKAAIEDLITYFQKQDELHAHIRELEYLAFEHAYFVPSKELVLADTKSEYLKKFRKYIDERFPHARRNPYIKKMLSKKDRIMLALLNLRMYHVMNLMSALRRAKDR